MARARNIKPGFFRNADLVELSFESRLLFIGLWTLADRSGRLEDKPKQIKMEIFPADNIDCNALLDDLASTGMLARYEVDGKRYLQVVNFAKHQNPHRDEKASTIPAQFEEQEEAVKPDANTVQAPCNTDARTVAIVLNPDVLIPDSLIPDSLKGGGSASDVGETPPTAVAPTPPFLIEYQKVIEANRPDLTATAPQVWALFCEQYPPEKRGIARWTKWVAEEKKPPQSLQLVTTPAKPGIDPTLAALLKESASGIVKPPNAEMRAKLAQLSGART